MANDLRTIDAHSAEHFGDSRDHWWNADFLELMAKRWRLDAVREVLDVGCGVGHWGMLLASVMRDDVRVMGVDRETIWIATATQRAGERGLGERFSYREGDAQRLPFPDDTFDLTTCQTLLIHVPDPKAAIAEMIRVTKPGGLIAVAEPNNLTESLLLDSITNLASIEDIVELVRLQLTCERGKVALGEGDNSIGDRLPGLFAASGLADVDVYANDKASPVFAPYTRVAERLFVDDTRDRVARRLWNWSEPEARRLFVAAGGSERDFVALFARGLAARERIVRGIDDGTFHGIIGGAFYLVSGRKPT